MADDPRLHPFDYIVLVFLMLISAAVGIYHGRKQKTTGDYFLAGRSMHPLPVSVSLAVSAISAITFLGTTSLGYFGGMAYFPVFISRVLAGIFTALAICPVFYNLKITSIFEYLEKRFNPTVRYVAVGEQVLLTFLILGIVVYAPALALNAATGLSISGSIVTIGLVSTFYSAIGGIKAVVWNDFIQGIIMVIGLFILILTAMIKSGGIDESISRWREGGRTTVADFRIDPTITLTVWSAVFGGFFLGVSYGGTNQNQSQRYLTCKDLRSAKQAVFWGFVWSGLLEVLSVLAGVSIYSYYASCDPLLSGKIGKADQILPYFIVDAFNGVPGMPGFLLGSVFCAALSTISTAINGMTTITGTDIVRRIWPNIPEVKFITLMKVVSLCYGLLFMVMAFAAAGMSDLLVKLTQSVIGAIGGPVLGVFLLGILVPRASSKGALLGMLVGTFLGVWILVGSVANPKPSVTLPLSTASCPINTVLIESPNNLTTTSSIVAPTTTSWLDTDEMSTSMDDVNDGNTRTPLVAGFYSVSFLYVAFISTVPTFLVGLIVAVIAPSDESVHSSLLSPVLWCAYKTPESFWFKNVHKEDDTKNTDVEKSTVSVIVRNMKTEDTKF